MEKTKRQIKTFVSKFGSAVFYLNERPLLFVFSLAPVLNFFVEVLSRRSLLGAAGHMFSRPLVFLCNALIIMLTLSLGLAFRRRLFTFAFVSFLWLGLGITNFIVLGQRTTPLGAIDFKGLTKAVGILQFYFSVPEIVLMALAVVLIVGGIVFLWFKVPKEKKAAYRRAIVSVPAIFLTLLLILNIGADSKALGNSFENLADAYERYGFAYCFSYGLLDTGVDEPEDYGPELISDLLDKIGYRGDPEENDGPNIIFLQLESFFDPQRLKGVVFSENPIPYFTALSSDYPSGLVSVPSIGAGTANTEFEAMTGMSLSNFGPGEYPYKTILSKTASESAAYVLKAQGYAAHAIHNHAALFYDRKNVFPNLGFDSFTSLEYMQDVEFNSIGWAKDGVLTGEILKTLGSTDGRDYIYTISVQGHGKYPPKAPETPYAIRSYGILDENTENALEYYVNALREMDDFLRELVAALESFDEDVALVVFGDHLPKLDLDFDDLEKGDKFQTDLLIWQNFGDPEHFELNIDLYRLYSKVFELYGLDCGVMGSLHNSGLTGGEYDAALGALTYDLLYGERYAWGGEERCKPTQMIMGSEKIRINSASLSGGILEVCGSGFTEFSKIILDGELLETRYISSGRLSAEVKLEPGGEVCVAQTAEGGIELGRTESVFLPNPREER